MSKSYDEKIKGVFAEKLQDEIANSGKKISELAEEIGIASGSLSKYQNAEAVAGITNLKRIADYFGVSCDYLLGGADCKAANNEAIRKRTGLLDDAIGILESTVSKDKGCTFVLNELIENGSLVTLCNEMWHRLKHVEDLLDFMKITQENESNQVQINEFLNVLFSRDKSLPFNFETQEFFNQLRDFQLEYWVRHTVETTIKGLIGKGHGSECNLSKAQAKRLKVLREKAERETLSNA